MCLCQAVDLYESWTGYCRISYSNNIDTIAIFLFVFGRSRAFVEGQLSSGAAEQTMSGKKIISKTTRHYRVNSRTS